MDALPPVIRRGAELPRRDLRRQQDQELARAAERRLGKHHGTRWDERFVAHVLRPGQLRKDLYEAYVLGTSFVGTLALGFMGGDELRHRRQLCVGCTFRSAKTFRFVGWVPFCHGDNGGRGCGCPESVLWPFGWLTWKVRLANYVCPIGKFDRRWPTVCVRVMGAVGAVSKWLRRPFKRFSNRSF